MSAEPATAVYEALAKDWAQLLHLDEVDPDDDFFEAGGHSLTALQIVARIRARHDVELPVADVFEHSTVRGLARVVEALLREGAGEERDGHDH